MFTKSCEHCGSDFTVKYPSEAKRQRFCSRTCVSIYTNTTRYGSLSERLQKHSELDEQTGCIEWQRFRNEQGYGVTCKDKKPMQAHRASWEVHNGPIPNGLLVLHKCDNPCCINPDHLFIGTHLDNAEDRERKGRGGQPTGEASGMSKLNAWEVRIIKRLLAYKTVGSTAIGRVFSVSPSAVWNIETGNTWKHIHNTGAKP